MSNISGSKIGVVAGDNTSINKVVVNQGVDLRTQFRAYLEHLALETDLLPLGSMASDKEGATAEGITLSDVYTSLDTTETERVSCEEDVRAMQRGGEAKRIPVQKMINDCSKLVLLSDPGCGKTTVVNFIANSLSRAWIEKNGAACLTRLRELGGWQHGELVPIRVELRQYGSWLAERPAQGDLLAWFASSFNELGFGALWSSFLGKLPAKKPYFFFLFDGLDEVSTTVREQVVANIERFASKYRPQRYLVTCRIYAYVEPGYRLRTFRQAALAPFSREQINAFIIAWYNKSIKQRPSLKEKLIREIKELKDAVQRPDIIPLAEQPLILTVISLLYSADGRLPDDRVELYSWVVDLLLSQWKKRTDDERTLMDLLSEAKVKMNDLKTGLYHVAFHVHSTQGLREGTADISEGSLLEVLKDYLGGYGFAEKFVAHVRERSGLLIRRKTGVYTFPHRTFQEFLAGCHLVNNREYAANAAALVKENPVLYRVVFVLAAGYAAWRDQLFNAVTSVGRLCRRPVQKARKIRKEDFKYSVIAGEALLEIGVQSLLRNPEEGEELLQRVREWLLKAMVADDILHPVERAEAGNVLAGLGDPRFDPDNWYLPRSENFGFVHIPAGSFWIGTDKKNDYWWTKDDRSRQNVTLSEYWISCYPVTVDQYRAFANSTGRQLANNWHKYNRYGNHPVVEINWYDAVAYCEWLNERLLLPEGLRVCLPSEAQWERAARGMNSLSYPWGNAVINLSRTNFKVKFKEYIGSTSPVGCYPSGSSINGLQDMGGNVWEWCRDKVMFYREETYYDSVHDPLGKKGSSRVLRGGSWCGGGDACRGASRRTGIPPLSCRSFYGLRLVLSVQSKDEMLIHFHTT